MSLEDHYHRLLKENQATKDPVARVTQRDAIVRSVLQVAAVCALEESLYAARIDEEGRAVERLYRYADSLLESPKSDGLYEEILSNVSLGQIGIPGAKARSVGQSRETAKRWVEDRNRRAHGVVSRGAAELSLEKIADVAVARLVQSLSCLFPDSRHIRSKGAPPVTHDQDPRPGVLLEKKRGADQFVATLLDLDREETFFVVVPGSSLLLPSNRSHPSFQERNGVRWGGRLPPRRPRFVGRVAELEWLSNWSTSEPRLLHGRGGGGKTAVAVEFVHRLLERRLAPRAAALRFRYVYYYSAKVTWLEEGGRLRREDGVHFLADALLGFADFMSAATEKRFDLGRRDRNVQASKMVEGCARACKQAGISPTEILLVLDNTETLVLPRTLPDGRASRLDDGHQRGRARPFKRVMAIADRAR